MKNKVLLFVSLCAICMGVWKVQAGNIETTPISFMEINIPNGYNEIDLHGELMFSVGNNAIIAGASDNAVYVGFNQTFGNVSISIFNSLGGLIYSTVVNTDIQQEIIIPLPTTTAGTYTVELNAFDGYADGEFEIE